MSAGETRPLRIGLDARLSEGTSGGIESVVIGLADALSKLDGDEKYLFLAWPGASAWLGQYVGGPCSLLSMSRPTKSSRLVRLGRRAGIGMPPLVPRSDGTIERTRLDVMHFTFQSGFVTDVPSIYHPHDLQHRHLPQFFSEDERRRRDVVYRTLCEQAEMVAVTSSWVRHDVVRQFELPQEKVEVVPLAPVLTAYPEPSPQDLRDARAALDLPDSFALYPAQTWAHKNHLRLLDALAVLRDRGGPRVDLVCCGRMTEFFPTIEEHTRRLGLVDQVRFTGFVSPLELRSLYTLARVVVIPSTFEAASGPLWDAFLSGVPAACSTVTSLPDQAGDAALLFDPDSAEELAAALDRVWTDDELRRTLVSRGKEQVARFTWDRTARHFRAHYRRIAGRELTEEDMAILSEPPLL